MSKVDWSLAPEDATHFGSGEDCGFWVKIDKDTQYFINISSWDNGHWKESPEPDDVSLLVERPRKPWSGPEDGLPPINAICEFMWNYKREGSEYVKARVLHNDNGSLIVRILDGEGNGSLKENRGGDCGGHPIFRPIKTSEQKAADKRETAIRELMDIAQVDCRVTAARLVDAGFKREVV